MIEYSQGVLICLLSAHVAGDFLLQSSRMARRKRQDWRAFFQHAFVVAVASYLLCGLWTGWPLFIYVLLSHGIIDLITIRSGSGSLQAFVADQSMHITALALFCWPPVLSLLLPGAVQDLFWINRFGAAYLSGIVLAAGAIVTVQAGGVFTRKIVEPLASHIEDAGLPGGGLLIGQLERTLIFFLVLSGHAGSLSFLIAAKSILRFGELKDTRNRQQAEYIIVGTLASFAFGLASALLTRWAASIVA